MIVHDTRCDEPERDDDKPIRRRPLVPQLPPEDPDEGKGRE